MLTVLARAGHREINWLIAIASFIGVLAFQMATNLFNDYGDHMKGQDRVRPQGGSRAIQNGWVRARSVKIAALGLTGFAALCGVPAIVRAPVLILAGLALLFTMEFAFQRLRLKARGLAEGIAFLLTGPLLTVGYIYAVTGDATLADASLGCIFGAIALLYFHSANFENIMVDSQAGARTWATRAGFDASKTFFHLVAVACVVISVIHCLAVEQSPRLLALPLAQTALLYLATRRVASLKSPLSSELQGLRDYGIQLSWLTAFRDDSELRVDAVRVSLSLQERGFVLDRIDGVLSLRDLKDPTLQPLSVDFSSPQLLHRLKTSGKNQPLAKAVGLHLGKPSVIDTTAGLGTDALVLAALGCRVRSFERNETIFALLQDGHSRLKAVDPELASRLNFENGDALVLLTHITERPDVVYLDPMYPEETHSSGPSEEDDADVLGVLLDGDKDSEELWSSAMKVAMKRVVVKRSLKAPSLGHRKPTHSFEGKTARFDLYLADQ